MVSETSQAETREERERLAFLPGSNVYRSLKKRLFPELQQRALETAAWPCSRVPGGSAASDCPGHRSPSPRMFGTHRSQTSQLLTMTISPDHFPDAKRFF